MKTKGKKLLTVFLILVMVLSFSTISFADSGTVTVSVTYGSFNTTGAYTGSGFTNLNFNISDYEMNIDDIQDLVDFGLKETFYLPVTDPMGGQASVLDAILVAFLENGYDEIDAGWDGWSTPNGGYISNVLPQTITYNPPTYYEGPNGNKWGHATGTGWNVAYTQDGDIKGADVYASNVALEDDMEIVFDISPYAMDWDTGMPWTE
mgnify:FL=1